jgi:hypothetical protein
MTTHRDPETIVTAWLHEGPTDLPDVTRRAILTALPTTSPARRGLFAPGRIIPMNPLVRLAIAVLVAALAVGAGLAFLGRADGPSVGGSPTPSVGPTQETPRPTPTASGGPNFDLSTPSPLQGRAERLPVPFSYVLPAGAGLVVAHDDPYANFYQFRRQIDGETWDAALVIRAVTGGRLDPCGVSGNGPRPLADPQAFIDYFRTIPTVSVSDVTSVTVDGHPGLGATLEFAPATTECPDVWLWYEDGSVTQNGRRQPTRVTIVDVEGQHYALLTALPNSPLYEASQELVRSIRFDPSATPSGG